jgi:ABC-2 type transport system permease protein
MLTANWRAARSYRVRTVLSVVSLGAAVVPIWYAARALQPFMASRIQGEGQQYFAFLVLGLAVFSLISTAITALPAAVGAGISSGTLETMLGTPIKTRELVAGLMAFDMCWAAVRAALVVAIAAAFGAEIVLARIPFAIGITMLIVASYVPFGLLGAALVLLYRTSGPLPQAILLLSGLCGGVYFPARVIPSWIHELPNFIPLTFGLRALRAVVIDDASLGTVGRDLVLLSSMTAVLLLCASVLFLAALRHARRFGALAQV